MIVINLYESYGIYGIRNKINGKMYIGKTQDSFGDRRDCHWASLNGGYGVNKYLQNAWNKYGEENFEFIVVHNCVNGESTDDINELEIKYIKDCKSSDISYNIGDGCDGGNMLGKHLSEETKRKIGEKNRVNMLGKKASDETKRKMSESQKKRYEMWTEEDRVRHGELMSECASGYKWSEDSKKRFSDMQKTNPNGAKYDVAKIKEIRRLYEVEGKSIREISDIFFIPYGTISGIVKYRRWKYV